MTKRQTEEDLDASAAIAAFEREIGVTGVPNKRVQIGNREFLKFSVGRESQLYTYALHQSQKTLEDSNIFKGAIGLDLGKADNFASSIEANALLTLLTRSTRAVSQDSSAQGYAVPYVPFQKREDHQLAQPASQIVRGRRGVGKSTLIRRAMELLSVTSAIVAVLDMQAYSMLSGDDLIREVIYDACVAFSASSVATAYRMGKSINLEKLDKLSTDIIDGTLLIQRIPSALKRTLSEITKSIDGNIFLFLDDFHLVDNDSQPILLHALHASLKGANGWLKVAGLGSLLNVYSPKTKQGLQIPGDAQYISLDLTLENPEAAEAHLGVILKGFLTAVGYTFSQAVIPQEAFRRLAWANAGVPRDFLQMFARALTHAQRNRHASVTLSDVNVAIGEFGQQKMDELLGDARNDAGQLREMLAKLERLCLEVNQVNAFLVRSDASNERKLVEILSDLRMVHLIHQSITPSNVGEKYQAFILDYSLFTGFRRRRKVTEMLPTQLQFRAQDLRALPKVKSGFLTDPLIMESVS